MEIFNNIIYFTGASITLICIILCMMLAIVCKSKNSEGERIELNSNSTEQKWPLGTWIAGVFVAGTGVALMYAPSDLIGYVKEGLSPIESIIMISLLTGAPVWALYSIMGLWYMKHMDSKIGKIAAMLSTILGMSISLWTGMNTIARFIGFEIPGLRFIMAAITVLISIISAKKNLLKGMSKLAFLVFMFAFLSIISTPIDNIQLSTISGSVTGEFANKYFFGSTTASWIFWFLSWTPTVSRWLAQISKGRTMKEYISGTMVLPTILAFIWMTVSWIYQDIIMKFNLSSNLTYCIPCAIFIISGILFMTGTLDSDCQVFTEDLESITKGKIKKVFAIPYYGLFVLFIFSLFISGIIKNPFGFNEYSSLIFMPLMIWSIIDSVKIFKDNIKRNKKI